MQKKEKDSTDPFSNDIPRCNWKADYPGITAIAGEHPALLYFQGRWYSTRNTPRQFPVVWEYHSLRWRCLDRPDSSSTLLESGAKLTTQQPITFMQSDCQVDSLLELLSNQSRGKRRTCVKNSRVIEGVEGSVSERWDIWTLAESDSFGFLVNPRSQFEG